MCFLFLGFYEKKLKIKSKNGKQIYIIFIFPSQYLKNKKLKNKTESKEALKLVHVAREEKLIGADVGI